MTSESLDSISGIPSLSPRMGQREVPGRRHSIAVGQTIPRADVNTGRRKSIQESLQSLTQSMTSGLRLALRSSRDTVYLGDNTVLDKATMKELLSEHYGTQDLRVVKLSCQRRDIDRSTTEIHDMEVWIKLGGVRKKLDLVVSIGAKGFNKEIKVYNTVFTSLRHFLKRFHLSGRQYLFVADHYNLTPAVWRLNNGADTGAVDEEPETQPPEDDSDRQDQLGNFAERVLILDNVKLSGYRLNPELELYGLDYEHSVLLVSRLARFHAVSYAYRRDSDSNLLEEFSWLPTYSIEPISPQTMLRLENIFQQNDQFRQLTTVFIDSIKGINKSLLEKNLDKFGVLSHGCLTRQNILFKYRSELESRLFCSDMVAEDMSSFCYTSCSIDLLTLLFTAVQHEVREDYMPDLVCSVYYDSFATAVAAINNRLPVFLKSEFVKEFEQKLMVGFIAALNYFTQEYESSLRDREGKERLLNSPGHTSYSFTQYRDNVLAVARDVFQFKLNTKATIK